MTDPETGDLMVRDGALVVGDTTAQTAEAVLRAMRGEFKEFPLLGAETLKMLGGNEDPMWRADARNMLQACGVPASRIEIENGRITIE